MKRARVDAKRHRSPEGDAERKLGLLWGPPLTVEVDRTDSTCTRVQTTVSETQEGNGELRLTTENGKLVAPWGCPPVTRASPFDVSK